MAILWSFKEGSIKALRICIRRRFFKSFTVIQVQRESFHCQTPFTQWELVGLTDWRDVDSTNLTEVQEVLNLLGTIKYE
jgi:hypothetical protein